MIAALLIASTLTDLSFSARMPRGKLEVGGEYELELELKLSDEINPHYMWDEGFETGGLRRPLLLLELPACVELIGAVPDPLETPADFQLAFLNYPYGRRLFAEKETVRFTLISKPGREDRIGLNLIAYSGSLGTDTPEDSGFVRLRAELRVRPGVRARSKPSRDSSWGPEGGVHIGDEAPDFDLPKPDGSRLKLSSFRGESHVLLMVYRRET